MKDKDGEYFIGLLCSMLGMGLIGFALYVAPVIFLGVDFNVPEFIARLQHWYQHHNNFSGTLTALLLFVPVVLAAVLLFFIARRIDNDLGPEEDTSVVLPKSMTEAQTPAAAEAETPTTEQATPSEQLLSSATETRKRDNARIILIILIVLIVLVIAEVTLFYDILE